MGHHELMSANGGGWRCVVCGAVFPFETCLEEIMNSACSGASYTVTPSSKTPPHNTSVIYYPTTWTSDLTGPHGASGYTGDNRTPEQKGAEILRKAGYLSDES